MTTNKIEYDSNLPIKSVCELLECKNIGNLVTAASSNCFSKYL